MINLLENHACTCRLVTLQLYTGTVLLLFFSVGSLFELTELILEPNVAKSAPKRSPDFVFIAILGCQIDPKRGGGSKASEPPTHTPKSNFLAPFGSIWHCLATIWPSLGGPGRTLLKVSVLRGPLDPPWDPFRRHLGSKGDQKGALRPRSGCFGGVPGIVESSCHAYGAHSHPLHVLLILGDFMCALHVVLRPHTDCTT